jgi:NitT/TauT family transport system permease protein
MSREGWIRIAVIALAIALLEIACRLGLIDRFTVIPPSAMATALIELTKSPALLVEIGSSLLNILIAVISSVVVGTMIGIALHPLRRVRRIVDPFLSSYYALPLFAFYPFFIVLFGVGAVPIVIMGFLAGLAVMVLATLDGLDSIPRVLGKVARMHQLGPVATALRIQLPHAAPYVLSGVKLAIAYGFIGVIASEFILSGHGLGFAVGFAYNAFDTRTMYGLILFIVLLVILLNLLLHAWDQRLQLRRRRYGERT